MCEERASTKLSIKAQFRLSLWLNNQKASDKNTVKHYLVMALIIFSLRSDHVLDYKNAIGRNKSLSRNALKYAPNIRVKKH